MVMVMVMVMVDEEQQTRIYLFNSHGNFGKGNQWACSSTATGLAGRQISQRQREGLKESRSSGASGGRCLAAHR